MRANPQERVFGSMNMPRSESHEIYM